MFSGISQPELSNMELTVNHMVMPRNNPDSRLFQINNCEDEASDCAWNDEQNKMPGKKKIVISKMKMKNSFNF